MNLLLALILPTIASAVTCDSLNHLGEAGNVANANDDACVDIDECADDALNDCGVGGICTNWDVANSNGFTCACDATQGYHQAGPIHAHLWYNECEEFCGHPTNGQYGGMNNIGGPLYEFNGLVDDGGGNIVMLACDDVDECADDALNDCTEDGSTCVNTAPGFHCTCDQGFTATGAYKPTHTVYVTCEDYDECNGGMGPCSSSGATACVNTPGSYTCTCNSAYSGATCHADVDECTEGSATCPEHSTCNNLIGDYECVCDIGWESDDSAGACPGPTCDNKASCVDVDECRDGWTNTFYDNGAESTAIGGMHPSVPDAKAHLHGCHYSSICTNTPGNYSCSCDGAVYTNPEGGGQDDPCNDINECTTDTHQCDPNAACTNTWGGYTCACNVGWEATTATAQDDNPVCIDVDECRDGWSSSDTANGGFYNNGPESTAIGDMHGGNTGNVHGCNYLAVCTNTQGNYTCSCPAGYSGTGEMSTSDFCIDIDECSDETDECDANADCANNQGDYTCTCSTGWEATAATAQDDKQVCIDIDECATNHGGCHANATCTNSDGDHECACVEGYYGNGNLCAEINECEAHAAPGKGPMIGGDHDCHINATCTNTDGSYDCDCDVGTAGNGTYCAESCDDQVFVDHAEWGRLTCENLVNEDRCADDNVYLYCCATCDVLTASSTVLSTALPQLLSAMIAVFYLF